MPLAVVRLYSCEGESFLIFSSVFPCIFSHTEVWFHCNQVWVSCFEIMKSTLHLFGNVFSMASTEAIVSDTDLKDENLEDLKERVFRGVDKSFCIEILSSGLLEAATFPLAVPCPELVRECNARYDPVSETIKRDNGETLLAINHEVISLVFKILDYQFSNFSPAQSISEFNADRAGHRNNVAKY